MRSTTAALHSSSVCLSAQQGFFGAGTGSYDPKNFEMTSKFLAGGHENDPYFFGLIQKSGVFEALSSVLLLQEAKKFRASRDLLNIQCHALKKEQKFCLRRLFVPEIAHFCDRIALLATE